MLTIMQGVAEMSKFRILGLDGGGIRGLITAIWLQELESRLEKPLREYFDLIAGTSTGSILACAVAAGEPISTVRHLYRDKGSRVFPRRGSWLLDRIGRSFLQGLSAPIYSDSGLEEVLKETFANKKFADLPARVLVVTYNTYDRVPLVLKNFGDHAHDHGQLPVWEVCKASSSAPAYFPGHVTASMPGGPAALPLIDGGVIANNPAMCALAEGVRYRQNAKQPSDMDQFLLASFGTGRQTRKISADEVREWGPVEWALPVLDVMMSGATSTVEYMCEQFLQAGTNYFRFQTRLEKGYDDMDNTTLTNLDALESVARYHLSSEGGKERIDQLAQILAQ